MTAPTNVVGEAIALTIRRSLAAQPIAALPDDIDIDIGWGEVIGAASGGMLGWLFARTYPKAAVNLYGIGIGVSLGLVAARLIKEWQD